MGLLGINTGISGSVFRTQNNMDLTSRLMQKSLERIETGNRITSAGDDPVGFAEALSLKNKKQDAEIRMAENDKSLRKLDDLDSRLTQILDALSEMKDLAVQKANASGLGAVDTIEAQMTDLGKSIAELQVGSDYAFGSAVAVTWGTETSQVATVEAITIATLDSSSTTTTINTAISNAMVGAGQVGVVKENVMASAQSLLTSRIEGFMDHMNSIMKVDEAEESANVTALQGRQQALVASLQVQNAFAASTVNFLA